MSIPDTSTKVEAVLRSDDMLKFGLRAERGGRERNGDGRQLSSRGRSRTQATLPAPNLSTKHDEKKNLGSLESQYYPPCTHAMSSWAEKQ